MYLAIRMNLAASSVGGKTLVALPPLATFVAVGFERSIASMYVVPVAVMEGVIPEDLVVFLPNLPLVTLGNVVGGLLV